MTFDSLEEKVVNWLMAENYQELVLKRYANIDNKKLLDSNKDTVDAALTEIFGAEGVQMFTKSYAEQKRFETAYDSKVYDYIFNSKNADSSSVIVGKDDRVFLVYVAPTPVKDQEGHEGHDHTKSVHAAVKEYKLETYAEELVYKYTKDDKEESKSFYDAIREDLLAESRKNTTTYKPAEDLAKAELDALKKTDAPKVWEDFASANATKPLEKNDTNTIPTVILNKIYPSGSKATKIDLTANTYYQVDDNGTSYVFKITEINATNLSCKVEYKTFEDEAYYSYYRAIKSKLDSAFKETSSTLAYPDSITTGSYQEWLFKSEYTEAENKRVFDRVKDDLTFIANVDSNNNVTSLTIYLVDEVAKQVNDEELTVYAAYQLFETEKEAVKALKKLNGLTGYKLLDMFTSFKLREEMGDNNEEGYAPGYVITSSPSISVDMTKADITEENLKNWLFDANRKADQYEIIAAADGKGYYLAVFSSSEQAWLRKARSGWVNESLENELKKLVADYSINEEVMEKIDGVISTTTAPTK